MSDDEFSSPGTAAGFRLANYEGRLLLFHVTSVETGINTTFGPTDAIKAYVEILDGPTAGEGYADSLIFGKVIIQQLSGSVGGRVLGRLEKGNAKPGQNAPWRLADPSEMDKTIARKHLAPKVPDKPPF